jgi:hypothetical protein
VISNLDVNARYNDIIMEILSTLPHLLCILPLLQTERVKFTQYINVVLLSTFMSVLYHAYNESHPVINAADYTMAFIWFLYDASYWDARILAANLWSFFTHSMAGASYHSLWHLLNASKCYYVSIRIRYKLNNECLE